MFVVVVVVAGLVGVVGVVVVVFIHNSSRSSSTAAATTNSTPRTAVQNFEQLIGSIKRSGTLNVSRERPTMSPGSTDLFSIPPTCILVQGETICYHHNVRKWFRHWQHGASPEPIWLNADVLEG